MIELDGDDRIYLRAWEDSWKELNGLTQLTGGLFVQSPLARCLLILAKFPQDEQYDARWKKMKAWLVKHGADYKEVCSQALEKCMEYNNTPLWFEIMNILTPHPSLVPVPWHVRASKTVDFQDSIHSLSLETLKNIARSLLGAFFYNQPQVMGWVYDHPEIPMDWDLFFKISGRNIHQGFYERINTLGWFKDQCEQGRIPNFTPTQIQELSQNFWLNAVDGYANADLKIKAALEEKRIQPRDHYQIFVSALLKIKPSLVEWFKQEYTSEVLLDWMKRELPGEPKKGGAFRELWSRTYEPLVLEREITLQSKVLETVLVSKVRTRF